jgi:integrase
LKAIFNAPIYKGCKSSRGWKHSGSEILVDSGRYWVPLISLFSGARLGEIVQLRIADVLEEQSILHFALLDEEEDQRLKNENSRRRIPVHPKLIELGFRDLLWQRRERGEVRLFPDLPMGEDGYYSSPFSKFYGRFSNERGGQRSEDNLSQLPA